MNVTAEPEVFPVRVWFNPVKLWQVTDKLDRSEADALIERVCLLAERGDYAALQQYDFVRIGQYRDIRWS